MADVTKLYSLNGAKPALLPVKFQTPDGKTRTAPEQWTDAELAAWGFVEKTKPPAVNTNTHNPPVWTGTAWQSTQKTIATRKVEMKAAARAAALARPVAGTNATLDGQSVAVASTDEAVARLQGVPRYLAASGNSAMDVVMSSGAPVAMTAAMAEQALAAVDALYAACEAWQYAKYTAIGAATTHAQLTAIDITTGLPA